MNDDKKYKRFYLDWWRIKRSTIYSLIFFVLVVGGVSYGLWYASQRDWFASAIPTETPKDAARITSFEGDVRVVRASTRQIDRVMNNSFFVAAGDTIQTQADGKAIVQMADGAILTVRPNSTVIIRDNSSLLGGTNVRVALGGGQINVKTDDQTNESKNIVEVRQSENRVLGQTEASFNINQTNNAGEIRINRGTVESTANNEKTIIKDGEFASVNNGSVMPKEKIISPPKLLSPTTLEQYFVGESGQAETTLRWQKIDAQIASYSVELSTSPFFVADTVVLQKDQITLPSLSISQLKPNSYFWRVRAVGISGQMSEWSEPWKFTVALRDESASLTASDWAVENIGGTIYVVTGKTAAGATIRILGRETFSVADGTFKLQISSTANTVAVEIKNEHGERSRYSLNLQTAKASRMN